MRIWRDILCPTPNTNWNQEEDFSLGTRLFEAAHEAQVSKTPPVEGIHDHNKILEEIEFDVVKDASGQAHPYDFAKGYPFGLTFSQKNYEVSDPYIKDAPLRNIVSKDLVDTLLGRKLIWKEKAGVLHFGGQISTVIPLAPLLGGSIGPVLGFAADTFLRYRTLYPYTGGRFEGLPVPVTAKIAATLPAGAEFEFIGHVGGGVSVGTSITQGYAMGPAVAGAMLYATSGIAGASELGICVTALDKKGHIRLTVRRLNKVDTSFSVGVTAGLMYQIASNWTSTISPNSTVLPQSKTTSNYLGTFTGISTATASASAGASDAFTTILSIDLDESKPAAQEIYKNLLLLRFSDALEIAERNKDVARIAIAHEKSTTLNRDANLTVLGETLLQEKESDDLVTGDLALPSGHMSYVDSTVNHGQTFWIWGNREVKWQEVNIETENCGEKKPYFRFQYANTDRRFSLKRLDSFIRFAKLFGIAEEKIIGGGNLRLAAIRERLKKAAKVEIKYDLYFSNKGIEKILDSTTAKVQTAYIEASRKAKIEFAETPLLRDDDNSKKACALLALFDKRVKKHRFDIFGITPHMNECYVKYSKLTGRSLSLDYALMKETESFATLVTQTKPEQCLSERAQLLFAELGKKKRFDFKQSIVALLTLASREEVHVHEMSLKSGSIKLEATPEKEIKHPHDSLASHLVSAVHFETQV